MRDLPTVVVCFYCGEAKDRAFRSLLLRNPDAPRTATTMEPCDHCRLLMEVGVILISVADGEHEKIARKEAAYVQTGSPRQRPFIPNPERTGGWVHLGMDMCDKTFGPAATRVLRERGWAFIEDDAWGRLGLPRGTRNDAGETN